MNSEHEITEWIRSWQEGDAQARDRVFVRLYPELKRLASSILRGESSHETMQPTSLLNDALIKLTCAAHAPRADDRSHFARIVARAMRQVLVDRARRKMTEKRGRGDVPLSLEGHDVAVETSPIDLLAIDEALTSLAEFDAVAAQVVELRVFAGMTIEETAKALNIHPSAVGREWTHATAWLKDRLEES